MTMPQPLAIEVLRKEANTEEIDCQSSKEVEPISTIIGQDRAVKALKFGLGIKGQGFNIFITGYDGTGKTSAAKRFINQVAEEKPTPGDWIYVNNFKDSYCPNAIKFPPGQARDFKNSMRDLIENVSNKIAEAFDSEDYAGKKDEITQKYQEEKDRLFREVSEYAQRNSFAIQQSPKGFETVPLNQDGRPIEGQEYNQLTEEQRHEIEEKGKEIQQTLKDTVRKIQKLERELSKEIQKLDQDVARYNIEPMFDELKEQYEGYERIQQYLDDVLEEILANLGFFSKGDQKQSQDPYYAIQVQRFMKQFEVNVLVDNKDLKGAPVIMEHNPTYNNLFGKIEKEASFGAMETDLTLIREGSIHQANGGYIIIPIVDLMQHFLSWESLINALKNEQITIEDATEKMGFMATKSLSPEAIPLDLKVILIGQPSHYQVLYNMVDDFRKLFKVKSDFDSQMDRTHQNVKDYLGFVCRVCNEEEELNHLDKSGLKKIIEHASRLAEHQNKLTTRFRQIQDVISEANYYTEENGNRQITEKEVKKAIEEKIYRSNLIQEKIQEMIHEETLIIDVEGDKVGELNGLAVLDLGDLSFGRPNKITASLGLGKGNILDIEREAKMGGPIHTKGVLILSGYLMKKYGIDQPMNLSIRLVFEQNYSGVDGDSASSAEVYVSMSEISGIPLNQEIAVTGSMNQKGEVQAIGGVNEKIEGFYEVCKQKGLTGGQGVMIPQANVKHLMLKEEVIEACQNGNFQVWPVSHVEEGFSILTGKDPGEADENGQFPEGTFNRIMVDKLNELHEKYQEQSTSGNDKENNQ